MEIPTREDFGLVWMGDMLLQNESNDLMMEHAVDSPFFADSSSQALAEDEIRCRNQMGIDGFMMLEDLDDTTRWYVNGMPEEMMLDNDPANASKVVTTATQTGLQNAPPGSRKIKPVKHPGLKLQTPIAYQRDTDLNVIPIQKDGRAVCKKCGAIGVKHAFYTRERRYCSLACARGSVETDINNQDMIPLPSNAQWSEETLPLTQSPLSQLPENQPTMYLGMNCNQPQYIVQQQTLLDSQLPPVFILPPEEPPLSDKKNLMNQYTYDWTPQLNDPFFSAAPVTCFRHAPVVDMWHSVEVGVKVEVENTDLDDFCEEFPNSFWIASILRIEGYKALLRYDGFVGDASKDFWVNLCSSSVHPVGWCAERGKPLIPPKTIKDKYSNWKSFLKHRLTGARTLPHNFYNIVQESLKSRFRCDLTVEVVDKTRISQIKVATIEKIIGKRLQLRYCDSKPSSAELFWCHEDSPLIHPVGWAKRIGQKLEAPPQYHDRVMKGLREKDDSTADLFITPERLPLPPNCYFQEGMKLEAIDPLNLGDICVATVMQVLNEGYLMIRVDFWNDQNPSTNDWFCYHMTSPCIFPAGFCASNDISLTPPKDYNRATFDWNRYLQETGCVAAPSQLFNHEISDHGFEIGMKIEAADVMNPRLVCVATVTRIVGRLLRIHFDGWENDFDQWIDCNSCDIYPVGWCELVSHKLEPPYSESKPVADEHKPGTRKKRGKSRHPVTAPSKTISTNPDKIVRDVASTVVSVPETNTYVCEIGEDDTVADVKSGLSNETWRPNAAVAPDFDDGGSVSNISCTSPIKVRNVNTSLSDSEENSAALARVNISNSATASPSVGHQSPQTVIMTEPNTCIVEKPKIIPRLSDYKSRGSSSTVVPETWDVNDVAEFLKINDCSTYCDAFIKQGIDGRKLLELTKEEVHVLAGMKVGPSLKIQNLITQLTSKICSGHSRHNKIPKNML